MEASTGTFLVASNMSNSLFSVVCINPVYMSNRVLSVYFGAPLPICTDITEIREGKYPYKQSYTDILYLYKCNLASKNSGV